MKKQKLGRSLDIYTQIKKHCLLQPDHTKVQQCSSFIICRRELHIHLLDKLSSQVFNFRLHLLDLVQVFLALSFFNKLFERSRWSKNPDMKKKGKIAKFVPELSCWAQFRPSTTKTFDSVPELSYLAQFRPSTTKTSDSVPELSCWAQFRPSAIKPFDSVPELSCWAQFQI